MTALKIFLLVAWVEYGSSAHIFSSGSTFDCPDEGRFPDPKDCTSYFTCVRNATSDCFTPTRRSCPPGLAYSVPRNNCVTQEKVPECLLSRRQAREENHRAPEYDHLCAKDGFRCGDCKHFIDCKDKKAYMQETCDPDHTCQEHHANFQHGVCYARKVDPTECACLVGGMQMADPYNKPNGYFECRADDSDPEVHRCPEGETYNEETMICEDPEKYPDCLKQGDFPVPNDCNKYYHCTHDSEGGYVKMKLICDNPLHQYDTKTQKCSDPCDWNWSPVHFTCKKEGFFQHPSICSDYFKCISDGTGGFEAKHLTCPKHMNFKFDGNHYGECVSKAEHACVIAGDSGDSSANQCLKPDYCS